MVIGPPLPLSLSGLRDRLLPALWAMTERSSKLEIALDADFVSQGLSIKIYNLETKKLFKKPITREDLENGKFTSIVNDLIKEALGEG